MQPVYSAYSFKLVIQQPDTRLQASPCRYLHQHATTRVPAILRVPVAPHTLSDPPHGIPAEFHGQMSCLFVVYFPREWVCASETSYAHQYRY